MNTDKLKKYEIVEIAAFVISSLSFLLFYFADYQKNAFSRILGYLLPCIFWGGLIAGVIIQIIISAKLKDRVHGRVGAVLFFKNKYAVVFDALTIISFIAVLALLIKGINSFAAFLAISLLIASFELHCVFNGKYFNYMLTKEDIKNE